MIMEDNFAHLARLAIAGQQDDVRLFIAKMIRKHREENPRLAEKLEEFLRDQRHTRSSSPLRKKNFEPTHIAPLPVDEESRLNLLKKYEDTTTNLKPLLNKNLRQTFAQLICEWQQTEKLNNLGLHPSRSAIFLGPPGVGKTISARWLAAQLNMPLFVLDLTTVMSSLLGKTGANIRAALEHAKRTPSVLLLDEIDAIAKRRSDDADVGELKRLVTVILQEVDDWPATSLLLAATNHPEMIDPALWRRFDLVVEFKLPNPAQVKEAINQFAGKDTYFINQWLEVLTYIFQGSSFSDIERTLHRFRRVLALGNTCIDNFIVDLLQERIPDLDKIQCKTLAILLAEKTQLSQRSIAQLTGISRDTIRKQRQTLHK